MLPKNINIIAYAMKSANDCDYRDPYDWILYGKFDFNTDLLLLHEERFQGNYFILIV